MVSNAIFYDQFAQWAEKYDGRVKISVVNDGTTSNEDRLGALGDLKLCIDQHKIDEDLMVLVSDNYLTNDNTLLNFYNFYKEKGTACVLGSKFDDLEYLGKNFGVAVLDAIRTMRVCMCAYISAWASVLLVQVKRQFQGLE